MATKYQDSTPQMRIWKAGQVNDPHGWTTWGYDSVLVTLVSRELTQGKLVFEGYVGFEPRDERAWGNWFELSGKDVYENTTIRGLEVSDGKVAILFNTIGFSQFRVREEEKLVGDGEVEIALACHAGS